MTTSRIRAGLTFQGADGSLRRVVAFLAMKEVVRTITDGSGVAIARSTPVTTVTYADAAGALHSTTLAEFAKRVAPNGGARG